jgi:alpha-1,3-glucosyltransferase
VTILSLILLFLPFLPPFAPPTGVLDPISRIFPFFRGLFEDKVANFWCFSNVVFKWRNRASPANLVKLSTFLTAVGFSPAVVGLLRTGFSMRIRDDLVTEKTPSAGTDGDKGQESKDLATGPGPLFSLLLLSMLTSSISFFLFSFQVHEKTILVPLLPLTLLMTGASGCVGSTTWELGMLTNNVAVFRWDVIETITRIDDSLSLSFSMWPLLKRDGLQVQYVALTLMWNAALGYTPFKRPESFCQFVSLVSDLAGCCYPPVF